MRVRNRGDILTAMHMTKALADQIGFSTPEGLFLQLATEEACTNAYEHCGLGGRGYIEVCWETLDTAMEVQVRQEGKPFDLDRMLRISSRQAESPRGRGLALISGLMDELELTSRGKQVILSMRKMVATDKYRRNHS